MAFPLELVFLRDETFIELFLSFQSLLLSSISSWMYILIPHPAIVSKLWSPLISSVGTSSYTAYILQPFYSQSFYEIHVFIFFQLFQNKVNVRAILSTSLINQIRNDMWVYVLYIYWLNIGLHVTFLSNEVDQFVWFFCH